MDIFLQLEILVYVAAALVLGAIIGFEREVADKPAGMRTHMLVAGASALFVLLGNVLIEEFQDGVAVGVVRSDPLRIVEAVVAGVAFLGAGTIIRHRGPTGVAGLTTAASLFFTAGIGVSVAVKHLILATGATALVLVTLRLMRSVEYRIKRSVHKEP